MRFLSVLPALLAALTVLPACTSESPKPTGESGTGKTDPDMLRVVTKAKLPALLRESSGLCYTDGHLWTFGDSGNPNAIYKIDSSSGAILQTVTIANFPNVDWEDITADSSFIYIGDFGNNGGTRQDLKIIRIRKSDLDQTAQKISVNGEAIRFQYADQTSFTRADETDFNCEALLSFQDNLYIFTKDGIDLRTRCYKVPKTPGEYMVMPTSTFDVKGKITAAAYDAATGEMALLGYENAANQSFIWFFNGYTGDDFFGGTAAVYTVGNVKYWQTEGLAYITAGSLFVSNETTSLRAAALYVVYKP